MQALLSASHGIEGISLVVAALLLLAAAVHDVRKFKIANGFSLALVALFPVYVWASGIPFLPHLITGVLVLGCGFGLFALRLLGGGDVKLISAAALWAGPQFIGTFLFATTFIGGALAFGYAMAALRRYKKQQAEKQDDTSGEKKTDDALSWRKAPVPYGVAIACGGWLILFKMAHHLFT